MKMPNLFSRLNKTNQLKNKVVLITGGTSGLGRALLEYALGEGARVTTCARSSKDLEALHKKYPEVLTSTCDVGNSQEVQNFIQKSIQHFGQIDILINNAGIIMVGGMKNFSKEDYQQAMDVMYWGIVHTTLGIVPEMKKQGGGQIVNITSVGGKVSIPKLLPYSSAKFAAIGFSEGITAELKEHNIFVTTVIPGLMRTGSYVNALFPDQGKKIFKLFSMISSAPGLTVTADEAAKRIFKAVKHKKTFKTIGLPAKALIEIHHFMPAILLKIFSLTSKFIPESPETDLVKGEKIMNTEMNPEVPLIKNFGHQAIDRFQHL